jgi:hypothetical protein
VIRPGVSWGALRPLRRAEWTERDGRVTLFVPRLGRGRVARRVEGWLGVRPYQVHLDELGSSVWRDCDGSTPVRAIAGRLRERFGERVEPAEDRLVEFLRGLLRGRFVSVQ